MQLGRLRCVCWKGNPFSPPPPPPPPSSADLRCLPLRLGYGSPTSSVFRRLVQGGFLDPYQFSRKKILRAVLRALECLEVHVRGQSLLVSFGHNSCILYHLPRRDSLSFSVRAVGVVSLKKKKKKRGAFFFRPLTFRGRSIW